MGHPTEQIAARLLGRLPAGPVADALLPLTAPDQLAEANVSVPAPTGTVIEMMDSVPAPTAVVLTGHLTDSEALTYLAHHARRKTVREAARLNVNLPYARVTAAIRGAFADGQEDAAWTIAERLVDTDPDVVLELYQAGTLRHEGAQPVRRRVLTAAIRNSGSQAVIDYCQRDKPTGRVLESLISEATRMLDGSYFWDLTDEAVFALASRGTDSIGARLLDQVGAEAIADHPDAVKLLSRSQTVRQAMVAQAYRRQRPVPLEELTDMFMVQTVAKDLGTALVANTDWEVDERAAELLSRAERNNFHPKFLGGYSSLVDRLTPSAVAWLEANSGLLSASDLEMLRLKLYRTGHASHLRDVLLETSDNIAVLLELGPSVHELGVLAASGRFTVPQLIRLLTSVPLDQLPPALIGWLVANGGAEVADVPSSALTSEFATSFEGEPFNTREPARQVLAREGESSFSDEDVFAFAQMAGVSQPVDVIVDVLRRRGLLDRWTEQGEAEIHALATHVSAVLRDGGDVDEAEWRLLADTFPVASWLTVEDSAVSLHRYLDERFGATPEAWTVAVTMMGDWDGTLATLLDAVEALTGTAAA